MTQILRQRIFSTHLLWILVAIAWLGVGNYSCGLADESLSSTSLWVSSPGWVLALAQEGATSADSKDQQASQAPAAGQPAAAEKAPAQAAQGEAPATAAAAPPPAAPPEARPTAPQIPEGEIYEVRPQSFKIEVSLSGKFHPENTAEIILRPKSTSTFRIKNAVEHGTAVKKGDVLIEFETDRFEEALSDQRRRVESATIALKRAEEELRYAEAVGPLDMLAAQRAKRMADEDWEYFQKVDRPFMEKIAKFSAEVSRWYLEYEQEELRQLQKMYEADELTDETEEIILRRQKHNVQMAEMDVERSDKGLEETMKFTLPRLTESEELAVKRAEHTYRYLETTLPLRVVEAKIALEQAKETLEREKKRLAELEADRALLTIRAPIDGVVYYGEIRRGSWSGTTTSADRLQPGNSADLNKVLMTVVQPRPLSVWAEVPENRVARLRAGLNGSAETPVLPGAYLPARLAEITAAPIRERTFAARVEVDLPAEAGNVAPGTTCQVTFIPYYKQRTVVVPSTAVGSDPLEPARKFVYRLENNRLVRQAVTVGAQEGEKVEILDGIVAGDRILRNYATGEKLAAR
jgi:multidrug efflux pump subunit AcrA (membrane-fusion protein)